MDHWGVGVVVVGVGGGRPLGKTETTPPSAIPQRPPHPHPLQPPPPRPKPPPPATPPSRTAATSPPFALRPRSPKFAGFFLFFFFFGKGHSSHPAPRTCSLTREAVPKYATDNYVNN
jgi:hypothetical protein